LNKQLIPNITALEELDLFLHVKTMGFVDSMIVLPENPGRTGSDN
jgi:hypothetical protein